MFWIVKRAVIFSVLMPLLALASPDSKAAETIYLPEIPGVTVRQLEHVVDDLIIACRSAVLNHSSLRSEPKKCIGQFSFRADSLSICGVDAHSVEKFRELLSELLNVCIPNVLFGPSKFQLLEYTLKSDVMEAAGLSASLDGELSNFHFYVHRCSIGYITVSGYIVYSVNEVGLDVMVIIPATC